MDVQRIIYSDLNNLFSILYIDKSGPIPLPQSIEMAANNLGILKTFIENVIKLIKL